MTTRDALLSLALKLQGCPYVWGGSNPWTGLDCSGFVVWCYQVFGIIPSGRLDAQGLYNEFHATRLPAADTPPHGNLVFYGQGIEKITHVMLALDRDLVIGASGGDRSTTTIEEAHRRGAQVKVKPAFYRRDRLVLVTVRMPDEKAA